MSTEEIMISFTDRNSSVNEESRCDQPIANVLRLRRFRLRNEVDRARDQEGLRVVECDKDKAE